MIDILKIASLRFFKNEPKRRSFLDIQRMADSIMTNGFINPILYHRFADVKGSPEYVIDGKCRVLALRLLIKQNKWPSHRLVKGMKSGLVAAIHLSGISKKQLKEIVIASHGSYSIMTENSLRSFVGKSDIGLHHYAFPEGGLIDFYEEQLDVSAFFTDVKRVSKKNESIGGLLA